MVIRGPGSRVNAGNPPVRKPPVSRPGMPGSRRGAPSGPRRPLNDDNNDSGLKLCMLELAGKPCSEPLQEWALGGTHLNIGRQDGNEIQLTHDPESSRKHCTISDGYVRDNGSFNGTYVNGNRMDKERIQLRPRDKLKVGLSIFEVRRGAVSSAELSRTKLFPGMNTLEVAEKVAEDARVASMSVEELMEEEFNKVIGHAGIKQQLRRFYKKVQLDSIREANGRLKNKQGCYHMIFQGPPGTGKTSMANLVAKVMVKMGLTTTPKVVFVNNALDLLAGYAGQTAGKVDDKVKEAEGGVLFIDEAYSIVQNESKESFGREAIDTIMKHLDPPACVFIFAGYVDPMADFVRMNDGLSRRIPFRYTFNPYSVDELLQICKVMSEAKGERLADDVMQPAHLPALIEAVNVDARETHNAGLISNLVSFSQIERDCRIDIEEAQRNPAIACTLAWADFAAAWPKLERMLDRGGGDGNNQKYNDNASDLGSQVQEMHL